MYHTHKDKLTNAGFTVRKYAWNQNTFLQKKWI